MFCYESNGIIKLHKLCAVLEIGLCLDCCWCCYCLLLISENGARIIFEICTVNIKSIPQSYNHHPHFLFQWRFYRWLVHCPVNNVLSDMIKQREPMSRLMFIRLIHFAKNYRFKGKGIYGLLDFRLISTKSIPNISTMFIQLKHTHTHWLNTRTGSQHGWGSLL